MKKIATAVTLMLGLAFVSTGSASAAEEVPGTSPENPIVVTDPSMVPEGAVEDEVSTYDTPEACDTTRSWVYTVPANEETSHEEFKFGRFVQGTEEVSHTEYRFGIDQRTFTPAQDEVTKQVYSYKKSVQDYKTQYHFAKFTRTRTQAPAVDGFWQNFEPNRDQGTFNGPPTWPTDPRGTWSAKKYNGGPQQDASGVFQNGSGNGSWFYRSQGQTFDWSAYGDWTKWSPETHTSWEDSDAPLGSPQFHGSGTYGDGTKWERQWQAMFDGQTREVENGSHYEYTGETDRVLGEPWIMLRGYPKTVTVTEAIPASFGPWVFKEFTPWTSVNTLPADPDLQSGEDNFLNLLRIALTDPETRTVIDQPATEGYREFFVLYEEPSRNIEDASWVTAEQSPGEGWTQFDQRTVKHGDGTPEVVTYFAYTDGAECEKPEGFENTDTTEKCVKGDLVTTNSTETGTPVQAEDGSWTVEVTATSSQSVKEDALKCAPKDNPPPPNNPPSTPNVPTSVDAGLSGPTADTQDDNMRAGLLVGGGLLVMLAAGLALTNQRRNGTEK
jgi:hypothetical protein